MKVIAINGSPREKGNTFEALKIVCEELENNGIETEIIQIGAKNIGGCLSCGACAKNKNKKCIIEDNVNTAIQKMRKADGILIGSPVYYASIAGTLKSFLDRTFYVAGANGGLFRHKVGGAIAISRRAGGVTTFDQLNHYFTISEMFIASSNYWNDLHGGAMGEVLKDEEGIQILKILAKNMAFLIKAIDTNSKDLPKKEAKIKTNFIR